MQGVRRRLLTASAVLCGGIIAAIPFYHGPEKGGAAEPRSSSPMGDGNVPLQIPSEDKELGQNQKHPSNQTSQARHTHQPTKKLPAVESPAPQMSNMHPAAENQVPPANTIHRIVNTSSAESESPEQTEKPTQRTHRIRDGDSLELLARRFLGDASRWPEIRDANKDVLVADDILPIGKELRIPPRDNRKTSPTEEVDPKTLIEPNQTAPSRLVPIPWREQ